MLTLWNPKYMLQRQESNSEETSLVTKSADRTFYQKHSVSLVFEIIFWKLKQFVSFACESLQIFFINIICITVAREVNV